MNKPSASAVVSAAAAPEVKWPAFGSAIVKARLVVNNFMHLAWEKRIVKWVLATSLILMFLMVAGVAPDVMNHEGNNWENVAAKAEVERGLAYMAGYEGEEEEDEEIAIEPPSKTKAEEEKLKTKKIKKNIW